MIGSTLSHYEIIDRIGSGGMGDVYLAKDTELGRDVALKVLPPELAESEERRARFKREAKALAALNHPNIVTVHSVEQAEDVHFITMELVKGKTLADNLSASGISLGAFVKLAVPLADAVAAAHAQGIVHRDLKPGNIMLTEDGRVKVLDFGLAKPTGSFGTSAVSDLPTLPKTDEGVVVGTVSYMSPEQAQGKTVDVRSDVFSLGVVFFELLTGRVPFTGDTPTGVLSSIIKDEPPSLAELVPSLPRDATRIVKRCLAKEPLRRYQTAIDVRNDLEELASALDSGELAAPAGVEPTATRGRLALGFLTAVLGALAALAAYSFVANEGASNVETPTLTNARQITSAVGVEDFPTWSPDGVTLAYESDQSGNMDIWVQQIDGGPPVNRTAGSPARDSNPSWSPDGRNIAFLSDRDSQGYYVMSALGGEAREVLDSFESTIFTAPQWLGQGSELLGYDEDGKDLQIVALDTRARRSLSLPVPTLATADWSLSPDGRFIAYVEAVSRGAAVSRIWLMRLDDGQTFPITDDGNNWNPMWSHGGDSLYFISNQGGATDLWARRIDPSRGPVGSAVPVTVGIGMRSASFSRDGTKLAYSQGRPVWNAWRVPILRDRQATWADAAPITSEQAYVEELDLSPDGTHLVLNSDRSGNLDLWSIPLDGGEWTPLTHHTLPDWAPRFSRDGREVVFHSHRNGTRDLFIMPAGGGVIQPITQTPELEIQASFSPDGRRIVFNDVSTRNIWVVSRDDGSRRPLIEIPELQMLPEWSPDGEQIIFTTMSGRIGSGLWVASSDGTNAIRLTDNSGVGARWSKDGRSIYFIRDHNVWWISRDGSAERQMTDLTGRRGEIGAAGLATDGENLYFTWGGETGDIWVMDVVP